MGFGRGRYMTRCSNLWEMWPIRQGPVDRQQPTLAADCRSNPKSLNATAAPGMSRRRDTSIDPTVRRTDNE